MDSEPFSSSKINTFGYYEENNIVDNPAGSELSLATFWQQVESVVDFLVSKNKLLLMILVLALLH